MNSSKVSKHFEVAVKIRGTQFYFLDKTGKYLVYLMYFVLLMVITYNPVKSYKIIAIITKL